MVMSWLLHSMQPHIANNYLFLSTAKAIWDSVPKTYSKRGNKARMYELRQRVSQLRQGNQPLSFYYSTLHSLWEEIDFYKTFKAKYTEDAALYNQEIEEKQVFELFTGLHPAYEPIRVHILGKDPLPSLDEVFSYLSQKEDHFNLMTQSSQPMIINRSTLVSSIQHGGRGSFHIRGCGRGVSPSNDRNKLKCEHCGHSRHTNETCWDLHGRPPQQFQPQTQRGRGGFRPQDRSSAHSVTSFSEQASSPVPIVDSSSFSADQIEALCYFIASLEPSSLAPASSFAKSGVSASAFSASVTSPHHYQIIDSGASDHMTGIPSHLSSYSVYSGKDKV